MDDRDQLPAEPNETSHDSSSEGVSQFFGSAKDVMDKYHHCVICGANLHFTYVTDFSRNLTQEVARCPECGVKARRVTHRLQ